MMLPISANQREWLVGTFDREALRILTLTEKEQRQRLPQKVLELRRKLKEAAITLNIEVDRNDLKIIQQQTANYITTIRTKVLPEHEKRIAKSSEAAAHYTPYRDALVERLKDLEPLLEKVEDLL